MWDKLIDQWILS